MEHAAGRRKVNVPTDKRPQPEEQKERVEKMLEALNLIRIEPTRIVLRKYTPDFSMPTHEWKK